MNTYKLIVSGKVQGVCYRRYVQNTSNSLGYFGYVKNITDGSVEVVVNIEFKSELEPLISKLYEGSTFSKVQNVECRKIDFIKFKNFEKRF